MEHLIMRGPSPNIFSDDEETEKKAGLADNKNDDEESEEEALLKKMTQMLGGIPPPPSHVCDVSWSEMLDRINKNMDTCGLPPNPPNPLQNANPKVFYMNSGKTSEEISDITQKLLARLVPNETASTWSYMAALEKKESNSDRKRRLYNGISPGRRLSHLARRRQIFSRANLQQMAQNEPKNRLAIRTNIPKRNITKDFLDMKQGAGNGRSLPKRALFQSPDEPPVRAGYKTVQKMVPRRRLFNQPDPEPSNAVPPEGAGRYDVSGWLASQPFAGGRKRPREDCATRDNGRKRKCPRRSLDFSNSSPSEVSSQCSSMVEPRGQLTSFWKQKLLWAVAVAMKEKRLSYKDEAFKCCAGPLFNLCKKNLPSILGMNVNTSQASEKVLKFAKQHANEVLVSKGFSEKVHSKALTPVSNSVLNQKSEKLESGFVGKENVPSTPKRKKINCRGWRTCTKPEAKTTKLHKCRSFDNLDQIPDNFVWVGKNRNVMTAVKRKRSDSSEILVESTPVKNNFSFNCSQVVEETPEKLEEGCDTPHLVDTSVTSLNSNEKGKTVKFPALVRSKSPNGAGLHEISSLPATVTSKTPNGVQSSGEATLERKIFSFSEFVRSKSPELFDGEIFNIPMTLDEEKMSSFPTMVTSNSQKFYHGKVTGIPTSPDKQKTSSFPTLVTSPKKIQFTGEVLNKSPHLTTVVRSQSPETLPKNSTTTSFSPLVVAKSPEMPPELVKSPDWFYSPKKVSKLSPTVMTSKSPRKHFGEVTPEKWSADMSQEIPVESLTSVADLLCADQVRIVPAAIIVEEDAILNNDVGEYFAVEIENEEGDGLLEGHSPVLVETVPLEIVGYEKAETPLVLVEVDDNTASDVINNGEWKITNDSSDDVINNGEGKITIDSSDDVINDGEGNMDDNLSGDVISSVQEMACMENDLADDVINNAENVGINDGDGKMAHNSSCDVINDGDMVDVTTDYVISNGENKIDDNLTGDVISNATTVKLNLLDSKTVIEPEYFNQITSEKGLFIPEDSVLDGFADSSPKPENVVKTENVHHGTFEKDISVLENEIPLSPASKYTETSLQKPQNQKQSEDFNFFKKEEIDGSENEHNDSLDWSLSDQRGDETARNVSAMEKFVDSYVDVTGTDSAEEGDMSHSEEEGNMCTSTPLAALTKKLVKRSAWTIEKLPGLKIRVRHSERWDVANSSDEPKTPSSKDTSENTGKSYEKSDQNKIDVENNLASSILVKNSLNRQVSCGGSSMESYTMTELRDCLAIEKTLGGDESELSFYEENSDSEEECEPVINHSDNATDALYIREKPYEISPEITIPCFKKFDEVDDLPLSHLKSSNNQGNLRCHTPEGDTSSEDEVPLINHVTPSRLKQVCANTPTLTTIETPSNKNETPKNKFETFRTKIEPPKNKIETPSNKNVTPKNQIKTTKTMFETFETKIETPVNKMKTPRANKTPRAKGKTPRTEGKTPKTPRIKNETPRNKSDSSEDDVPLSQIKENTCSMNLVNEYSNQSTRTLRPAKHVYYGEEHSKSPVRHFREVSNLRENDSHFNYNYHDRQSSILFDDINFQNDKKESMDDVFDALLAEHKSESLQKVPEFSNTVSGSMVSEQLYQSKPELDNKKCSGSDNSISRCSGFCKSGQCSCYVTNEESFDCLTSEASKKCDLDDPSQDAVCTPGKVSIRKEEITPMRCGKKGRISLDVYKARSRENSTRKHTENLKVDFTTMSIEKPTENSKVKYDTHKSTIEWKVDSTSLSSGKSNETPKVDSALEHTQKWVDSTFVSSRKSTENPMVDLTQKSTHNSKMESTPKSTENVLYSTPKPSPKSMVDSTPTSAKKSKSTPKSTEYPIHSTHKSTEKIKVDPKSTEKKIYEIKLKNKNGIKPRKSTEHRRRSSISSDPDIDIHPASYKLDKAMYGLLAVLKDQKERISLEEMDEERRERKLRKKEQEIKKCNQIMLAAFNQRATVYGSLLRR